MLLASTILWCLPLVCGQAKRNGPAAQPNVAVQGMVRDGETQQPLAGVELLLSTGDREEAARSDAGGHFQAILRPGFLTARVTRAPCGYTFGRRAFRQPIEIDQSNDQATLPPIDLARGRTVRGKVVDRQGEPAAGATVQIIWRAKSPWLDSAIYSPRSLVTTSDQRGEFAFDGVDRFDDPRLAERFARLFVNRGDATLDAPQSMPVDDRLPALLRLEHDCGVSLSGRVSDGEGRPIAGVQAEVWLQWRADNHVVLGNGPLAIAGSQKIEVDAAGRFQTPPCLAPSGEYSVLFTAPGFLTERTAWARPSEAGELAVPSTRLRRLRMLTGRVVDATGSPVAGARVFQSGDGVERTETATDANGRFTLAGAAEGAAIVFVEQAGFHFHGQPVVGDAVDIHIPLRPISANSAPLSGTPSALSREEELQLARRAYRPLLDRAFGGQGSSDQSGVLWHWARIDPVDALGFIDGAKLPQADADEYDIFRFWVAKRLVVDSFEEAVAVAESIHDTDRRVQALVDMAGRLAPSQTDERRRLLDLALLYAAQAESAALQAIWLHVIADGLLDLGDVDRARELLDDARATVAALPPAGGGAAARGYVADVLSRLDVPAALELAATVAEDEYRDKTYGRIASRIAARQPAEAEKALDLVGDPYRRDGFYVRVCCRAAPADPQRARRLAGQIISPYLRSYALGLMARAVAESDLPQARAWLDEAFALLARIAAADEERLADVKLSAALVAGLLLPAAERVDANVLPDFCWRALSFRRPHSARDEAGVIESTAGLLMCLAQYDHRTARLLAEPLIDDVTAGKLAGGSLSDYLAFYTACVIDPRWAVEVLDDLPEIEPAGSSFRTDLAFALGAPPQKRLRTLFGNFLQLWWPDDPDNAFQQVD